ncbi:MAG: FtsX-like permease family protein [Clostridia bacterium]|nr:FtsX-like permease family protein [Clostridia bacterium]
MILSFKDLLKLTGIIIVSFCAVFVCTFFLNFYFDALSIESLVTDESQALYNAQLATARFTCGISGGVLGVIAAIMLVFYIKLYIDGHTKQLGILKAMGYSNFKMALKFWAFGLSVFIGVALGFGAGFAAMPMIYKALTIDGLPEVQITFHVGLPFALIIAPTALFTVLSCGYAYFAINRPVNEMLRGKPVNIKKKKQTALKEEGDRPFLVEMCLKTLRQKKSLAFFVAFACFCFSAMVQMGCSMWDLTEGNTMGVMILVMGVILAIVSMIMAMTSLVNGNNKNVAIMKVFGYSVKECAATILIGYIPFALIGFAVGTGYQFELLKLMMELVYKNVQSIPNYTFNVPIFFITFALFIVYYAVVTLIYCFKIKKISVKEIMTEN